MVHRQELLLGQQGGQFLQHRLQLQLVAQPPDADELRVDADGRADQAQLLRRDPGADLHVAAADEQRVQRAVPGPAVERLKSSMTTSTWNSFFAPVLGGLRYLLLLLDYRSECPLVPLVEVDLLPFGVHTHLVLYELLDGPPAVVDLYARRKDVDALKHAGTVRRAILLQDRADQRDRLPALAGSEEDPGAGQPRHYAMSRLLRGVLGVGE